MGAALTLSARTRGSTAPNPNVGCIVVADGRVVGRGWTRAGGRPHAEAEALAQAGAQALGAIAYVTLEPCAHESVRGPACSDLLIEHGVARVVIGLRDPDPRTDGLGIARLQAAGIAVTSDVRGEDAARAMAGFLTRRALGRPFVTLKLALSLDGAVSRADGQSQWITGPAARAHGHLERSRHEAILVGRGTAEIDRPKLDVRLPGLGERSPQRVVLSADCEAMDGFTMLPGVEALSDLSGDHVLVEGGAATAAAFLRADVVDRLLLYRAPILIGHGRTLPDIALTDLAAAHGRWRLHDARMLGSDRLEVYERVRIER
ncbi:bifunctional diaminohydroxyphosphoribosylaminopyrimidine deaminase/5-amino-6-(5-phosphoribosylamino)uracil reductase RibD [Sphingomonas sp. Leaf62]|uniref:bifunctional diaminohydroxyphosphoribosylaminopyrimidine deaminase/5-amino-6-(5-phosphoribosylamino)uracil reductase RibD n=1 Tax=Sphingomonas sp. Leaf62 TaxID=1736228 RepID=UPI0006F97370|nr:bifunctional diaminohydroxyphosphoribosylaminopyrimidine deaminase/5-amino-6-(5-phosphoribosylamino)uracil reductase RibD [Sphingomonas sp. Leaf62]KQN81096.1 riboflavin biosynthesis protein RibD [Sphingomonas sp. Leaf62]